MGAEQAFRKAVRLEGTGCPSAHMPPIREGTANLAARALPSGLQGALSLEGSARIGLCITRSGMVDSVIFL